MFFCAETPEDIVTLLEGYPEFQKLYGEIYELCRNVEKVIGMSVSYTHLDVYKRQQCG